MRTTLLILLISACSSPPSVGRSPTALPSKLLPLRVCRAGRPSTLLPEGSTPGERLLAAPSP